MAKLPHQSTVPPVDDQDGATKADGGAAESLQTTGADVDVAAAAPPSTGQVLKATGATTATWQAEAGGGGGVPGEQFIDTIRVGDVEGHDSATPKVVSQFQFDPTDYDMAVATRSLVFRAVAANGGGVASTNARLYNLTDGEAIATLNFTSAAPTMKETTLTEGAGAGEVDLSAKVYEVRIFVDAPDAIDDTIELGSAELRVINTVD